jgi:Septum formation
MRHRLAILVASSLVLLAGCGNPGGVDGDLTNRWAAIPAPTSFVPAPETCHLGNFALVGSRATYDEVDCELKHRTETVYVGTYASPAADADEPPAESSAGAREAYRICDLKTTEYVGGQWRGARIWLGVTHPSAAAWAGGARWFRCDVIQIVLGRDSALGRSGTLEGVLATPAGTALTLACFNPVVSAARVESMTPAPCAGRHHAEYVGRWAPRRPTPALLDDDARAARGCGSVIARYAGVPDDGDLKYRTGWIGFSPTPDEWNAGIRDVRCFLWLDDVTITGSYRNAGPAKLRINYV